MASSLITSARYKCKYNVDSWSFFSFPAPVLTLFILQSSLLRCYLRSSTSPEHMHLKAPHSRLMLHTTATPCLHYLLNVLHATVENFFFWGKIFLANTLTQWISFDHFLSTAKILQFSHQLRFFYSYFKFQFRFAS